MGFPGGTSDEEPTYQCRRYRRRGYSNPVFLPGESHGKGSLRRKESNRTEAV